MPPRTTAIFSPEAPDAVILEGRLTRVEGQVTNLSTSVSAILEQVNTISNRLGSLGRPNWTIILGVVGLIIPLVGAVAVFLRLQNTADISPLLPRLASLEASSDKIEENQVRNITAIAGVSERVAQQESALTEIEAQFRAGENYDAMRASEQSRLNGLLWKETFGNDLPNGNYYPSISQDRTRN